MSDENGIHDLDDLLGLRTIKIRVDGRTFDVPTFASLPPREVARVARIQADMIKVGEGDDDAAGRISGELSALFESLNPELAVADLSFLQQCEIVGLIVGVERGNAGKNPAGA